MKLVLLCGRAGTGKTRRCLDEIHTRLLESPEGAPLLFLLPEHATFKMELALTAAPGIDGFTRAYVLGFRRLAHRVLMECGGSVRPRITDLGKRLLIGKILAREKEQLSAFVRAAKQRNFCGTIVGMMEEFKTYGADSQVLGDAADKVGEMALLDKVRDLSLIYERYQQEMAGRYETSEDHMALLAEKLPESSLGRNAEVWLDGFTWFNPQELAVLGALLGCAKQVTVTLCLDDAAGLSQREETALFHRQWKTRQTLLTLAQLHGIEVEEHALVDAWRYASQGLAHLERHLFNYGAPKNSVFGAIRVAEAANRRREVEGMAADLCKLCREEGYRWRDVVVLLRDGDAYGELVEGVLREANIPYFREGKRSSVHHPLAELMRSALEAVRAFQYEPLFRVFKTGFFTSSRDEIDWVENYVLAEGIRGAQWLTEWNYGAGKYAPDQLAKLNEIRRALIAPLAALAEAVKASRTALQYTRALYAFLERLDAPGQLEARAAEARRSGRLDEAREHEQVWNGIIEILEQIVELCPDEVMDARGYGELIAEGLEGLQLSLIPPSLDYVTIASVEQNCADNSRAVYVLGVSDGAFPKRARDEGIIGDLERSRLKEHGASLAPGVNEDNFAERFFVYTALTRATEYLWLSYPLADHEGKGLFPSTVIRRIRALFLDCPVYTFPLESDPEQDILPLIATGSQAVGALAIHLRSLAKEGRMNPAWWDVYNWALRQDSMRMRLSTAIAGLFDRNSGVSLPPWLAKNLYARSGKLRGSVTRFETFSACPFRYFSEYGLRLKERDVYRVQRFDIGKFLHDILRLYGESLLQERRGWQEIDQSEQKRRIGAITKQLREEPAYRVLGSTAQNRNLLLRILRTAEFSIERLSAFSGVSDFSPFAYELSFGLGGKFPALSYALADGQTLLITGQIDRVDILNADNRTYYMVFDYKTGRAQLRLADVYYGLKLQLLTYLLAVGRFADRLFSTEAVPAAMLYCFLKLPVVSDAKKIAAGEVQKAVSDKLKMPGWALADPALIERIDGRVGDAAGFIKFALKKKEFDFTQATKPNVKDIEDFSCLVDYAAGKFRETGGRILAGEIAARPYTFQGETGCAYCPYTAVCRFDPALSWCGFEKLPLLSEEEMMRRIKEEVDAWHGLKNN